MTTSAFDDMPDEARVWIYGFDRPLGAREREALEAVLEDFVSHWTSHDQPVQGAWAVAEDRFVVLAGHCPAGLGGCSIDGSVAVVRTFAADHGLDALNRDLVFYRDADGAVEALTRTEFESGVGEGRFGTGTVVFDLTIPDLHALREGRFETTFDKSWHARAFAS